MRSRTKSTIRPSGVVKRLGGKSKPGGYRNEGVPLKFTFQTGLSFVMLAGALCVLAYFFHISYFPTIDGAGFTGLFLAAAYVGLTLLLIFGGALIMPGTVLALDLKDVVDKVVARQKKIALFGLVSATILVSFIANTAALFLFASQETVAGVATLIAAFVLVVAFWWWMLRSYSNGKGHVGSSIVSIASLWGGQWLAIFVVFSLFSHAPTGSLELSIWQIAVALGPAYLILALVGGVICYQTLYGHWRTAAISTLIWALVLPVLLTFAMDMKSFFPMLVAKETKLGNFFVPRIMVSSEACDTVNARLPGSCRRVGKVHVVDRVYVLSTVGKYYFIALYMGDQDGYEGRVYDLAKVLIPSDDILGIVPDEKNRFLLDGDVGPCLKRAAERVI